VTSTLTATFTGGATTSTFTGTQLRLPSPATSSRPSLPEQIIRQQGLSPYRPSRERRRPRRAQSVRLHQPAQSLSPRLPATLTRLKAPTMRQRSRGRSTRPPEPSRQLRQREAWPRRYLVVQLTPQRSLAVQSQVQ
jgi:hypothetical protein